MKILIDENLPAKLRYHLADLFPDMHHVRDLNRKAAADKVLTWRYDPIWFLLRSAEAPARRNGWFLLLEGRCPVLEELLLRSIKERGLQTQLIAELRDGLLV